MKNNFLYLQVACMLFLFGIAEAFSQSQRGFTYQAVARDASGALLANQNLTLVLDIRRDAANGPVIFQETHSTSTSALGLLQVTAGKGTPIVGNFASIDWAAHDYFLGVTLNGITLGASELQAVPYSMIATQMDLDQLQDVDAPAPATGEALKWNGTQWVSAPDNNTTYSAGAGLSLAGTTFSALDISPTNEIQALSLSGNTLSLSQGGGSVNLPTGTTYTAGDGIAISGANAISATLGTSIQTAEIDNIAVTEPKLAANAVSTGKIVNSAVTTDKIANGAVTAAKLNAMGAANGNLLRYTGSAWAPADPLTVSPWQIKPNGDIEYPNGRAYIGPSWGPLPSNFNLVVIDTTPTYIVVGGTQVNSGVAGGLAFTEGWNASGPCGFQFTVDGNAFGSTGLYLTGGCPQQNDTIFETSRGGQIIFRDVVKVEHNQPPDNKFGANTVDADLHVNMRIFDNTSTTSVNRRRGLAIRHRSSTARQWNIATRDDNNLEFFYNGTLRGTFSAANGAYTNTSDRNMKKNIEPMQAVLPHLQNLPAYRYRYIWQTEEEQDRSIGFMAQDVLKAFPELVHEVDYENEENTYQLNYAGLSVVAIKAIQEQQAVISALQEEVDALKEVVRQQGAILQRLDQLEQQLARQ